VAVPARELIGLDIGKKRTGVARASSVARLAEPLVTLETEQLATDLGEIIRKHEPQLIIVGLPRNLNGNDTEQTKWVRTMTSELRDQFPGMEFKLQDEALTTVAAAERLAKNSTEIDAVAASIILQDFLDGETAGKASSE
jgi:putative Holliday junction resolvase